jgi:hypothetical protein
VGAFPDGQSALNLAAARLRHIAGTAWSAKRYLNIELLKDQKMRGVITALSQGRAPLSQPKVRKILDTTQSLGWKHSPIAEAGCWPLARRAQHEDSRTRRC